MEQLILPEYESVVLTDEQFEAFRKDTIDIETDYLDEEECLYTTGMRGTIVDSYGSKAQVSGLYVYTTEWISEIKETINRICFFNSLDSAFDCRKKIKDKYQQIESKTNSEFERKQRQEALSKFISQT